MKFRLFFTFIWIGCLTFAQDDLLSEIDIDTDIQTEVSSVFKGLKVINFESTKMVPKRGFYFVVSHRFGSVKSGFKTLFGLDEAVTHLNFIYGVSDYFNLSASRTSNQKIYELASKVRLVNQTNTHPVSVVVYTSILANTALNSDNLPQLEFNHRLSYVAQLLISRKFSEALSLQLSPTFFHDNYVANDEQHNSQYGLAVGGRYKLGKRWSINLEYGAHLNRAENSLYNNPFSVGFDVETGGHVFQLHFTNSQFMNTNGVFANSTGDWSDGDFYFGFNISRSF